MAGRSLLEQANDALDRALVATGAERDRLIGEAMRLYRLMIAEERQRAETRSKSKKDEP